MSLRKTVAGPGFLAVRSTFMARDGGQKIMDERRRMVSTRGRVFAGGVYRPACWPARGMVGRADARRARPGAPLGEAPYGTPLGPNSVARGGGRRARLRVQALSAAFDRPPLVAGGPRGLRHPAPEPGGGTIALGPGPPRPEDGGPGNAARRRLWDARHERPPGRRRAPRRPHAVHPRGRG